MILAPRWRVGLGMAIVAAGVVLAAWRLTPMLSKSAPEAPSLKSADPAIRVVEIGGGVLAVYADVTQAKDPADNFDKAAATVSAVGQAIKRGVSDDLHGVNTVRFSVRCQAINRFGQDVMAMLVTVDMPLTALKTEDYGKATPAQVLGLARTVSLGAPGAYDALASWCADPARGDKAFCAKAQAS